MLIFYYYNTGFFYFTGSNIFLLYLFRKAVHFSYCHRSVVMLSLYSFHIVTVHLFSKGPGKIAFIKMEITFYIFSNKKYECSLSNHKGNTFFINRQLEVYLKKCNKILFRIMEHFNLVKDYRIKTIVVMSYSSQLWL